MTKDLPDYESTPQVFGDSPIVDLAELAARLGSPYLFERRGDIVYLDDFEDCIDGAALPGRWGTGGSGTGYAVIASNTVSYTGLLSVKLTGGSDGSRNAFIQKNYPAARSTRWAQLFFFSLSSSANTASINNNLRGDNGTLLYQGLARLASDSLEIYTNGAWVTVKENLNLYHNSAQFHAFKLVIDYSTKKYVKLWLDDETVDISEYDLYSLASSGKKYRQAQAYVYSVAGKNAIMYLDNLVVTENEP